MKSYSILSVFLLVTSMAFAFTKMKVSDLLNYGPEYESKPFTAHGLTARQFNSRADLEAAGFTLGDMIFKGDIGPHYIEFNGTIQEIVAEAIKQHPEFDPDTYIAEAQAAKAAAAAVTTAADISGLESRGARNDGDMYCCPVGGQWFFNADGYATLTNIRYLQNLMSGNAYCGFNAGPGFCIRLACNHNSAILGCSDNNFPITVPCWTLADLAGVLLEDCSHIKSERPVVVTTCGQRFGFASTNAIVTGWNSC